jgi:phage recombination protein Bet
MNSLAVVSKPQQAIASGFSAEQIDLIKKTIAPDASDNELALFLSQCQRTGLDPFSRQIYFIKRGGKGTTQVSIDGFRVIAERSGEMDGQDVAWCAEDGLWRDVWLENAPPAAARVLVYRKGCSHPFPAIARWTEYNAGGNMWAKMPANQLAKCAEGLALRKAFPHQLAGLYTTEEMGQAEQPERLTIEATTRIALPEGTMQVLKVTPRSAGGAELAEVTYVDAAGEEHTHNTTVDWKGSAAALFEQLAQEAQPVVIVTKITPRSKKTVIEKVQRWPLEPDNAAIDAEIAAREKENAVL